MYTNISFLHGLRKKRNIKSSFLLYIMLGKLPFVLGYGVYCQNGGSEKIFFQFLTSCKKCLDAGKDRFLRKNFHSRKKSYMLCAELSRCPTVIPSVSCTWTKITSLSDFVAILSVWKSGPDQKYPGWPMEKIQEGVRVRPAAG